MFYNFYIKTFGCQMNLFDSIKIENLLKKNKFIKFDNINKNINYIIINTCSVRTTAQKKIFNFIKKFFNKNFCYIICGCSSNIFYNYFLKKKYIKIIIGVHNINNIILLIKFNKLYNLKQISINFHNKCEFFVENKSKYILISQGCNKNCSFCIIPSTRGFEISKNIIEILKEIYKINSNTIIIIGQNVSSYNFIINKKSIKFIELIGYIYIYINILGYSYITSHIKDFNKNFIYNHKINKKINTNIHLPIQSFSNKILNLMKRNYKNKNIKFLFLSFKLININIYTDIIICFYKESNIDFNKSLIFIEKYLIDKSFLYFYNPRPFTKLYYKFNEFGKIIKFYRFKKLIKKFKTNILYINNVIINKILSNNNMFTNYSLEFNFIYYNINNYKRLVKTKFIKNFNFNKFKLNYKLYNFYIINNG